MDKKNIKKVVLAYSGGLDTSIIIPWLKENYNNCEVIAVSGNVGQADELEGLEEKAIKTGASKIYIEDLTEEFVDDYVIPTVKAGALYEEYMLGTSFARPVIAKRIAEIAAVCEIESLLNNHPYDLSGGEQQRAALAKVLLTEGSLSLTKISELVGFSDYNYFSRVFHRQLGMTPNQYRKHNAN